MTQRVDAERQHFGAARRSLVYVFLDQVTRRCIPTGEGRRSRSSRSTSSAMTFEQLLQQLKEHGIRLTIRSSSAGGSHTPSIVAQGSGNQAKHPAYVAEWEQIGVPGKHGTMRVTREEAHQLINEGAKNEAGLMS